MKRRSLNRRLYGGLAIAGLCLAVLAAGNLAGVGWLSALYGVATDLSLFLVAAGAAYAAYLLQRRAIFLRSLREQWCRIVEAKAALMTYCDRQVTSTEDFIEALAAVSRAIDNMRIVYTNVGESTEDAGRYPFEALVDMRRALDSIDPRKHAPVSLDQKARARALAARAFYSLRERFLDEFEREEPEFPILEPGSRRLKQAERAGVAEPKGGQPVSGRRQAVPRLVRTDTPSAVPQHSVAVAQPAQGAATG